MRWHSTHDRATGDLDIWVEPTHQNAVRVHAALKASGAPLAELSVADLTQASVVFQIGVVPRRIDSLTSLSGLSFEEAWPHRVTAPFGDLECAFPGRNELIRNKRAIGRPRDLADLESLGE